MRQVLALHRAFAAGRLSPVDLVEHCLSRAQAFRGLNLLISECSESARTEAEASADRFRRGCPLGPLDGVPFVAKDNLCTSGIRTTCASRILHNYVPPYDATVIERLRAAGCVLVGKANMDEFAMGCGSLDSAFGPAKNPWTLLTHLKDCVTEDWFITGGSSGGSAGAVAAGLAVFGLGSDTGGSVRNPASYCGVVGLKPSYGRLSRHGLIPLVNAIESPGVLATSAEDAALVMSAAGGLDPKDSTTVARSETDPLADLSKAAPLPQLPRGLRIGIPIEYHAPGLHKEALDTWEAAAAWLADEAGSQVDPVSLPHTQHSVKCYSILCCAEVASNMARYDGLEFGHRAADAEHSTEALYAATRQEGFNEVVRSRIFAGNFYLLRSNSEKFMDRARRVWRLIHDDFSRAFDQCDLLLTPLTLSAARRHSWFAAADNRQRTSTEDVFTQAANLAGVAAVAVPVGRNADGLPLSVQVMAPCGCEHLVLSAAQWLETRAEFRHAALLDVGPQGPLCDAGGKEK